MMNTTNEEPKPADNMELLKQQAQSCGAGCACHCSGASGKVKMLICGAVLLVAAVLVVKAVRKTGESAPSGTVAGFAVPVGGDAAATPAAEPASAQAVASPIEASGNVGTEIGSLAELNTAAANTDAVFVYLPGKEATPGEAPATVMQAAARTVEAKGGKCALFTLRAGSPDYEKLGTQTPTPGVLAMVRGKGMSAISGEITETKLVQGYVAASSSGGCGPSGCGPGGCP